MQYDMFASIHACSKQDVKQISARKSCPLSISVQVPLNCSLHVNAYCSTHVIGCHARLTRKRLIADPALKFHQVYVKYARIKIWGAYTTHLSPGWPDKSATVTAFPIFAIIWKRFRSELVHPDFSHHLSRCETVLIYTFSCQPCHSYGQRLQQSILPLIVGQCSDM